MTKKISILLVMLFTMGFVAAGCGDDDDDSGSDAAPATTEEAPATGDSEVDSEAADAAREGCEAGIKNNPALDASKQDELSQECEKVAEAAASGDQDEYKAAYSSYCNKLAEAIPEAGRAAAKDACQQGADALP
jgi:hypothetical protein